MYVATHAPTVFNVSDDSCNQWSSSSVILRRVSYQNHPPQILVYGEQEHPLQRHLAVYRQQTGTNQGLFLGKRKVFCARYCFCIFDIIPTGGRI